jgi:polysaccharide pyruvyl transferase WcaK-like protein
MRVVCIGDIGVANDVIHIGDEAMFHEMVTQLRARGVDEIVAISSQPDESAARYGVRGIHRIGFFTDEARSRDLDDERMSRVLRTASGETGLLDADDPAHFVIDAIRTADGVAVAGGGNLASTWPTHIYERGTIALLARLFDVPLVVSGQTIGPYLTDTDGALVAQLLSSARLVGLREADSYAFSARLGVPEALLTQTIDDASFLAGDRVTLPERPYCVVTMAAHINGEDPAQFDLRMAQLLDGVAARTGLDIVFFAHFGSTRAEESVGDTIVHNRIRARMTSSAARVYRTTDSPAAAALARGAALSISSRYHPAVFAASAGVPSVGIAVDDYTTTKLTGALGNLGQSGVLPLADLLAGNGHATVAGVWDARETIRSQHAGIIDAARAASAAWWDRVAAALRGEAV